MKPVQMWGSGLVVAVFSILFFPTIASAGPRFYLDPKEEAVAAGGTTTVDLTIDTSGQVVTVADAKITFPKAFLESSAVTNGAFFDAMSKMVNNVSGTIEIHGYFSSASATQNKTGKGIVATVTFKGLAPGTATLAIPCAANSTTDANIVDTTGKDIIDCAMVSGSTLTITQSTGGTSVQPTPTPSTLPQAGIVTPTLALLGGGLLIFGYGFYMFKRAFV